MQLTFLGATGTVTGSKYLLEAQGQRFLIDCGLFQGHKELRLRNWQPLAVEPRSIDAVVLTHAHLDHTGYIPRLVKDGYTGPIYCTEATADLCSILLPDSGHIHEEDAKRANRYGYTKHSPALPLYTEEEALESLRYFKPLDFDQSNALGDGLEYSFHRAGHILGAAFIHLVAKQGKSVLFSGDIGRLQDPVMKAPAKPPDADYLLVESTYGDRLHQSSDPESDIGTIIQKTVERGGTVVIPAFAVGRAQAMLYYIYKLKEKGAIPDYLPIYLDSPMAINASELMGKHIGDHRLTRELCHAVCSVAKYTRSVEESKAILSDRSHVPKVIISASGMATGGRILHHLKHFVGDPQNTILFGGFQAGGTRGDKLTRGAETIRIHGNDWPVRAEIAQLHNMSAHGDYEEILTWLSGFKSKPTRTFVVHGEKEAAASMKARIESKFGWDVSLPEYLQKVDLL